MSYVHLFCHVGTAVVDHYLDGISFLTYPQTTIFKCLGALCRDPSVIKPEIDKSGTGDLCFGDDAVRWKMRDDLSGNLSGVFAQFFCQCHRTIELKITKFRFGRFRDRNRLCVNPCFFKCLFDDPVYF